MPQEWRAVSQGTYRKLGVTCNGCNSRKFVIWWQTPWRAPAIRDARAGGAFVHRGGRGTLRECHSLDSALDGLRERLYATQARTPD